MNERLGTIVRAKEGKMVNVNAQLPFNLHNRSLDPSATRSRSVSAHHQPAASTSQHRVPSYSPQRTESPSIQTSRSTSSLHPGDASYLPPEANPESGIRKPAFSVRLVRTAGPGIWTRRGRSVTRGRFSRFGDESRSGKQIGESSIWLENDSPNGAADAGEPNGKGKQVNGTANGADADAPPTAATDDHGADALFQHTSSPAGDDDPGCEATCCGEDGAAPEFHIEIEDVGKISQSWNDDVP